MQGIKIIIGGRERTIRFSHESLLIAQKLLDGRSVREVLALHRDFGVVIICAAAGMSHETTKISPKRICGWLDKTPVKYSELERAVMLAAEEAYRSAGLLDEDDEDEDEGEGNGNSSKGEDGEPGPKGATRGSHSSGAPDDGESTNESSST